MLIQKFLINNFWLIVRNNPPMKISVDFVLMYRSLDK